jgi:2-hydroxy-3-oxopropionate reductase
VGLGFMGRGMAANLAKGVSRLTVFDISKENSELFQKSLCQEHLATVNFAKSLRHLAEESDVICLSLPSDTSCREVLFGSHGVAQTWQSAPNERRLVIDHSTSSKDFAQKVSSELREQSPLFDYMDCPVSGGPAGAQNATLTIMAGGTAENFQEHLPLFRLMGKKVLHLGPTGYPSSGFFRRTDYLLSIDGLWNGWETCEQCTRNRSCTMRCGGDPYG